MHDSVCPDLQTSNQVITIMLRSDKAGAVKLTTELQDMRQILEEEGDAESSRFLKVLQVQHKRPLIDPTSSCYTPSNSPSDAMLSSCV